MTRSTRVFAPLVLVGFGAAVGDKARTRARKND
jgi:hypothetical protein